MKIVSIIQDVSIPGIPGFRRGQEVRIKDEIADMLVDRGHAKFVVGESREEVKAKLEKEKKNTQKPPDVSVSKTDEKAEKREI